jgi:OmpA-OmpF porin, OOP family
MPFTLGHERNLLMKRFFCLLLGCMFFMFPALSQQKDSQDCKDHPLFTRMPTYWIQHCELKEFDAYTFSIGNGKSIQVEGKYWRIHYYPQASIPTKASELQIQRNFENAVQKLGGKSLWKERSKETFEVIKDGKEVWVELRTEFTGKYFLFIVEKEAMKQDITANADEFFDDLKTTGHAAVYGIYFDTGKSDIKPESAQAIGEVAKLLGKDPGLNVYVVGHTDNVGGLDANMSLSQARANAVVQSLVRDHKVAASRLKAYGDGPYAPVTTNDTEEGRAKNRRVELVKQ